MNILITEYRVLDVQSDNTILATDSGCGCCSYTTPLSKADALAYIAREISNLQEFKASIQALPDIEPDSPQ